MHPTWRPAEIVVPHVELKKPELRLGLRANWRQLGLLTLNITFVGAMVGMERAVLPLVAEEHYGVLSRTALLSFLLTFGMAKATANLIAGSAADRFGRRRVLMWGWIVGLLVPLMIIFAPSWKWIVAANGLLGINQGLCWSAAVMMNLDLAGPRRRGFAVGLNEGAGYLGVAFAGLVSAFAAERFGLLPWPFVIGVAVALGGLVSSWFAGESRGHARLESAAACEVTAGRRIPGVLSDGKWRTRPLMVASQAGLVTNLNDGVSWGLFPLHLAALGATLTEIGWLVALYPAVWGVAQFVTGPLSDRTGRKPLIVAGMFVQAASLAVVALGKGLTPMVPGMVGLGLGTALVYPTLIGTVSDHALPADRASAVGVYRFWRDMGYAIGALASGLLADWLGLPSSILVVAGVTLASGLVVWYAPTMASGSKPSRSRGFEEGGNGIEVA